SISAAAACAAGSRQTLGYSSGGAGSTIASGGSGATIGGDSSGEGMGGLGLLSGVGGNGSGVGGNCASCSADLHDVLDCNGHVVKTCPPDQGCAAGSCVSPCSAAAENRSSIGCDYFTIAPNVYGSDTAPADVAGKGWCFAAYIVNTWSTPVTI